MYFCETQKLCCMCNAMENAALNKAHQQHRRADNHLRYRRYSDAIECHRSAVDLLNAALTCTENQRSLESINLQIDFHSRQKNIINIKREQHANYKRALAKKLSNESSNCETDDGKMLTKLIYNAIEETDSLIDIISKQRDLSSDTDSSKSGITELENHDEVDGGGALPIKGTKYPKDDKTVIEEFRIVNKQLHQWISQLVNQLDSTRRENEMLRARLRRFENEKVQNQKQSNSVKVPTDSSGGTSPYVFSPCSEFSLDIQESKPLPPLEMPKFDYTVSTQTATASKSQN